MKLLPKKARAFVSRKLAEAEWCPHAAVRRRAMLVVIPLVLLAAPVVLVTKLATIAGDAGREAWQFLREWATEPFITVAAFWRGESAMTEARWAKVVSQMDGKW